LLFSKELKLFQTEYLGLLISSSIAFAMRISDDAYDTRPWFKLAIQISCGVNFVMSGTTIEFFHHPILDGGLTILWVIILMNSLNMLDNMDGIIGTTTLFVLLSCLLIYFLSTGFSLSALSLLIISCIGTMVGFFKYNVHPSKMFMGDGGSQFIGVIVAFFTVKTLFHANEAIGTTIWLGPILALVALTSAAADTLTVVFNRLKAGKLPMVGGRSYDASPRMCREK
jgi:UDP-GlcNAc:undecaprenyl-phosphate/decaprenyl-phosphate GlcNAc-1-phosphate transferase